MGLLDEVLKTIQAGGATSDPRRVPVPAPSPGGPASHGMSPMAKVLLALLALYAAKNVRMAPSGSTRPASPSAPPTGPTTTGTTTASTPGGGGLDDLLKGPLGGLLRGGTAPGTGTGGGLGDLLKGPLGGILGGAAAGTILNGGLGGLLKELQQNGQGDVVNSWVGSGPNKTISHGDLASALGDDTLDQLASYGGMQREEVLSGLSSQLPRLVDSLTPHGRLMSDEEAARSL
jgi:uncharacterized protein YidB (DUF937 family)